MLPALSEVPAFSTYTQLPKTVTLTGIMPPDDSLSVKDSPLGVTWRTDRSLLPALTTKSHRRSRLSANPPWLDPVRPLIPSPLVATFAVHVRLPSADRL